MTLRIRRGRRGRDDLRPPRVRQGRQARPDRLRLRLRRPPAGRRSRAASEAVDAIWQVVTEKTASIFSRIFEAEQRKEISGIVGVSDVANQTIEIGIYPSLLLLALVSLSLGLINLLPILPLDGGHIFWALVEKVRGRPVSLRVMERATMVGFALVLLLMFIGLTNDIGRLNGEGFNVR